MFDPSIPHETVSAFNGPVLLVDAADVAPARGLLARNVSYIDGQAKTRLGFVNAFNVNEAVTRMCNWPGAVPGNTLVWFRSSDLTLGRGPVASLANNALSGILTGAYSAIMQAASTRMYASAFTTALRGVSGGNRVFSYQSAAFVNDSAFLGPVTFGGSGITEPGAGLITVGSHRFGFAIEYRSGFRTRLSPDNSAAGDVKLTTFQPYTFSAAGAKNMTWTITPSSTWPAAAVRVHVAMTTAANTSEYFFVPDASAAVTGGGAGAAAITFSISDADLVAYGEPATEHLYFLTQNTNAVDRIATYFVTFYGDRAVWLTTQPDEATNQRCVAFVSNVGRYQEITLDQHLVQLPGGLDINCAFALGQVLFLVGPTWTYQTSDNGGKPVDWPTPQLVDGRRGTLAISGVEVSPTGEYAWVADQTGLYLFKGRYDDLPVSYWQTPDWQRINWAYAHTVQIKDIPSKRKVVVIAPLDSATSPSHMLTFYYEHGKTYDKIRYSLDNFVNYDMGAIEVVKNTLSGAAADVVQKSDLWVAPSDADQMLREIALASESAPYQDQANPIRAMFETGLFPNGASGPLYDHHGETARLKCSGSTAVPLQMTVFGIDRVKGFPLQGLSVSSAPGQEYTRFCNLRSEGASVRLDSNVIPDPDFDLGGALWTPGAASWEVVSDSANAYSGSYVAKRTGNVTDSDLTNGREITISPAVTLYLEMWAKASGANGAIYLYATFYNSAGAAISTLGINTTGASGTYTKFSGTVTVPALTATMRLKLSGVSHTAGIWYIDDLAAIQVGTNWVWAEHRHYAKEWATRR